MTANDGFCAKTVPVSEIITDPNDTITARGNVYLSTTFAVGGVGIAKEGLTGAESASVLLLATILALIAWGLAANIRPKDRL